MLTLFVLNIVVGFGANVVAHGFVPGLIEGILGIILYTATIATVLAGVHEQKISFGDSISVGLKTLL